MPSIEPKVEAARLRTLCKVLILLGVKVLVLLGVKVLVLMGVKVLELLGVKRTEAYLVIIKKSAGSTHRVKHSVVDNSIHSQCDRVRGEDLLGRNLIHSGAGVNTADLKLFISIFLSMSVIYWSERSACDQWSN